MNGKATIILFGGLIVLGSIIFTRSRPSTPRAQVEQTEPLSAQRVIQLRLPAPQLPPTTFAHEPSVDRSGFTNLIARLLTGDESFKLNPRQIDQYLQQNRRNAESLLAAFRTTEDPAFLREAVEKYPADPRVNFAAYFAASNSSGSNPEERRQRLDALKQSAPNNSLADYLSAQEHFKTGQTDLGVEDLMTASAKTRFQDYSGDFVQNAEEAYRAAGYSAAEAKALAACSLPLPHLASVKRLGQNLVELAALYRGAGDEGSAQAALQMGINLAQRVGDPSGNRYLISELVGVSIEAQVLGAMNSGSLFDDAGRTVQDRMDELVQRREEIKKLADPSTWMGGERRDVLVTLWEKLPPQDVINFYDRVKVSGEREALQWAMNRLGWH